MFFASFAGYIAKRRKPQPGESRTLWFLYLHHGPFWYFRFRIAVDLLNFAAARNWHQKVPSFLFELPSLLLGISSPADYARSMFDVYIDYRWRLLRLSLRRFIRFPRRPF